MGRLNSGCSQQSCRDTFWREISSCEHLVQIYGNDDPLLDSLEGFVVGGFRKGENVIAILTPSHRTALEKRLAAFGFDVATGELRDQYIPLDAEKTLATFLIDGWPDQALFAGIVMNLLKRARKNGRQVRAFGEMVALLCARGPNGAAIRLEQFWHQLCHKENFPLFCAYPLDGFTREAASSIKEICAAHSQIVSS